MLRIRRIRREDVAFAVRLSNREGWGIPSRDFHRIIDLDPHGSFVATEAASRVGLTTTTSYGKEVAWIGNVVVAKRHRGKHIGQALVKQAVRYLTQKHIKRIVLYCYNENVQFYKGLGFVRGPPFARVRRERRLAQGHVPQLHSPKSLSLPSLLWVDERTFGADRSRLISSLLRSGHAWYLTYATKHSCSYLIVKNYADMCELGPWISVGLRRAELEAMLRVAMARARSKPIEVSCPFSNRGILRMLRRHHFRLIDRGRLMYYEKASRLGEPRAIVALGFLDKG